ncbi:MAG: hypothetical protein IPP89_00740 [Saprospiraceae bacterium]|nr:hypothetical protein [Candidatus Brachybacter algidus]MBL0117531.1 hypothetical protein [Candidatus Brachybacter algidus]
MGFVDNFSWTLLTFVAPLIFSLPTFYKLFGLADNPANIGDAIGGITSPIIGFMGAVLVYLAFRSQIRANEEIRDQFKYQSLNSYINDQVKIVREDIQSMNYSTITKKSSSVKGSAVEIERFEAKGSMAIANIVRSTLKDHICTYQHNLYATEFTLIISILERILNLFSEIESAQLADKKYLFSQVSNTYAFLLRPHFRRYTRHILEGNKICKKHGKSYHKIVIDSFSLIDKIEKFITLQSSFPLDKKS